MTATEMIAYIKAADASARASAARRDLPPGSSRAKVTTLKRSSGRSCPASTRRQSPCRIVLRGSVFMPHIIAALVTPLTGVIRSSR